MCITYGPPQGGGRRSRGGGVWIDGVAEITNWYTTSGRIDLMEWGGGRGSAEGPTMSCVGEWRENEMCKSA